MPSPIEFWLCASSFNPFNVLIAQPVTDDTCEVIPRLTCSSCHLPPFLFMSKYGLGKGSKKKKKYGIFHTLVGWVGLKKSFSIKNKNKKYGLKMPKIA